MLPVSSPLENPPMSLRLALALALIAAPTLAEPKVSVADIPPAVAAAVNAAQPGIIITQAELKEREGRRYYDVEGEVNGAEIELDLLETGETWTVVEIQRDIAWADAPANVRAAAGNVSPVRVIESKQAADGSIIYELFAEGKPAEPSLEVMLKDGEAKVLSERWPH